jgi:hypothetical protein
MTTVLRQLPFFETPTAVSVGSERVTIKPYQIIVWVSVTVRGQDCCSQAMFSARHQSTSLTTSPPLRVAKAGKMVFAR